MKEKIWPIKSRKYHEKISINKKKRNCVASRTNIFGRIYVYLSFYPYRQIVGAQSVALIAPRRTGPAPLLLLLLLLFFFFSIFISLL